MAEMLNIIAGTIEKKPSLREVNVLGKPKLISNNYLSIESEGGNHISVPIVAWDGVAEEFLQYDKGDKIHFLGVPNDSIINCEGTFVTTLGFTILKIDHNMKITLELNDRILKLINS